MRYADGPSGYDEVLVKAAPPRLWELVTDIELPVRFSTELRRVGWLNGASAPAVGACFEGHNHHPALGDWRTVSYVVELDTQRAFAWAVVDADNRFGGATADPATPAATWRFELTPEPGGTRLRQSVRIGPARSGLSLVIDRRPEDEEALVAARLEHLLTGIRATLTGIKALAEDR